MHIDKKESFFIVGITGFRCFALTACSSPPEPFEDDHAADGHIDDDEHSDGEDVKVGLLSELCASILYDEVRIISINWVKRGVLSALRFEVVKKNDER